MTATGGRATRNAAVMRWSFAAVGTLLAVVACTPQAPPREAMTTTSALPAGTSAPTMKNDLAHRSLAIQWPNGFSPEQAELFAHNEIFVRATCELAWQRIVEAPRWPEWYPNAKDVRLGDGGVLTSRSVSTWTTFGFPIESRMNEFTPPSRMGWFGSAPGQAPAFYHTWYLTTDGDGCRIVTEEVGRGENAAKFRRADEGGLHRGHDLWLATLKWVAETRQTK